MIPSASQGDQPPVPDVFISMTDSSNSSASDIRQLSRGGLGAFGIKLAAVALGFLSQFLIARYLGTAGYGELSFAWVTLNFLVILAVAGGDSVATRFVARFHDEPDSTRHFLDWLHGRSARITVLLLLASLLIIQLVRLVDSRDLWWITQILCLAVPFQVFSRLRQGILRGRQRPMLSQIPEEVIRPLLVILLVLVVARFSSGPESDLQVSRVAWIVVGVSVVVLASGQWLLSRELAGLSGSGLLKPWRWLLTGSSPDQPAADVDPQWRSMAWASTFSMMAMTLHSQADVWMLGVLVESDQVGPYAVAVRYAALVVFGINAVNLALAPLVARAAHDPVRLQQLASRAASLAFGLSAGVILVLLLFPGFSLGLFGAGFDQATVALRILVIANLVNVICGSVGMLLNMSGHHLDLIRILGWSMLLNIVLNAVLIPLYGTLGAAVATAVSTTFWNLAGVILVRQRLGVRPTWGGWI